MHIRTIPAALLTALLLSAARATPDDTTVADTPVSDTAASAVDSLIPAATDTVATVPKPSEKTDYKKTDDIVVLKENLDTVFIFDKSVFRHVARDWRNNIDIFRQRGYGVSGSSYYGANAIFIRPVEELAENLPSLSDKRFHFANVGFEPFLMSGGAGYIGLGEGFRLGGGGVSGERKFTSAPYNGDSILVLNTKVSYGGFLIEKCMLSGKWNFAAGGLIGGGNIKVAITEQANTFFYGENDDIINVDYQYNHHAVCFMLEPHFGVTYSFFYFFHLGARLSVPTFMSLDKFGIYTNDFFSVNPGIHVNLTFGNLG